jgi:hypothetical protein
MLKSTFAAAPSLCAFEPGAEQRVDLETGLSSILTILHLSVSRSLASSAGTGAVFLCRSCHASLSWVVPAPADSPVK